ncbi:MAG TPA: conjugal transfer protein TrbE [Bacillota bacterium]|jgi:type IV secretion/conjugal transfer VirB4 family ATPase|nr:conjugal transfer protein TrbE [Bacillota bacterium]HOL09909.1 conjugal transfer protein TrbE [Bacillota bacterium]HPO98135.1 conjugal transfer protein TrbE [Bacillota bacterium]
MLNLREYRKRPDRLSDYLPWAALVAPGVILNKDGSFQKSFRFRGPDLASATKAELVSISAQINNVLKRLTGGWAIYAEAQRIRSQSYPESVFPDPISLMIDEERKNFFEAGHHYETYYYFTLIYLPPQEVLNKLEKYFIERDYKKEQETYETHLKNFLTEVERVYNLFAELLAEAKPLNDEETLTYLHSCISPKRHIVRVPEIPMYLDAFLADTPLVGGFEPRLGNYHLRAVTVMGFPGTSIPGILDNLNHLNFEYRWVTRFIPLDKEDAKNEINRYRRRWFAKRKGVATLIRETITNTESVLEDSDAYVKSLDADQAAQELSADYVSYGYFTATVVVIDQDAVQVEKKVRAIEKTINSLGFTVMVETLNAVDAWMGSLPGLCRCNVRRPILNSLNLAHLFPLSAVWAGPRVNNHLKAPTLMYTQTAGNTPFRLDLHVGDVGHTMIVGPTGAGKSVLLATLAAQFLRYDGAQVYFFDKDGSCRALTAGVGGDFYDLADEREDTLSFQPLANIDDEKERAWAAEWVHDFLRGENIEITPEVKQTIWIALSSLATSPREQRTITGLTLLLQDTNLRQALQPATINGAFGKLFDAMYDNLEYGRWQVFEMAKLMNIPAAVPPTLSYLFHRLEQRFTGAPTLLVLDECWLFLDNPIFAAKIREWLKVLRKANVSVVFATQSLRDIQNSTIAPVIIDSCLTKIYLPNANARDEHIAETYEAFGLNSRELEILAMAIPKRQYYYKSPLGSRLFELALGPVALAYFAASSKEDQKMIINILNEKGKEGFNEAWLIYKKLPEMVKIYKGIISDNY